MKKLTLGRWTINPEINTISQTNESVPLEPLTMKMLIFMTERLGQVVTRQDLMEHLWGSTVVSNDSLNRIASQLRKVFLNDEDTLVETIRGVGYRLSNSTTTRVSGSGIPKKDYRKLVAGIFVIIIASVVIFRTGELDEKISTVSPELNDFTQLPGFLLNPNMSPDDKILAFSWNGGEGTQFNIYIMEEGSPTPIKFSDNGFDLGPEWSPEGDFIAFNSFNFKDQTSVLQIRSLIGNTTRRVENIGTLNGISPIDWSPDGEKIVISSAPKGQRRSQLHLINTENLALKRLTEKRGEVSDVMPRFSPDNKKVLFVRTDGKFNDLSPNQDRTNDVILVDLTTGGENPLLEDLPNLFGIEWLDEETIIYSTRQNHRSTVNSFSLNSEKHTVIFSSPNIRLQGLDLFNKSRQLVIEAQRFNNNIEVIGLTDTSAYSKKQVVEFTSSDFYPALNSEGQLAYISDYSGLEQLWLIDAPGAAPKQLTYFEEANNISNPEWSSAGDQIIFSIRAPIGKIGIGKIDINGTNYEILRKGNANYGSPTWSADQASIYFYSDSLGVLRQYKMELESRQTEKVAEGSVVMARETEKGLYYVKFDEAGIWFEDKSGQEELLVEDFTFISLAEWSISGNTLAYLSPKGNNTEYVLFDLDKREELKRIPLPRMKRPVPSLGVAFNLQENEIYITSSTEFTSALNTLSW
ncbi:MAG: hypothetical protein HEP71_20235 [Roseivirga sp.]|nr:hypothetical protein [Roseivirga sp.]